MDPLTIFKRATVAAFLTTALALAFGCEQGAEGDRCNPDLSHDECNSGLSCQQPVNCPENYCCPTSGTSSNPYCQPGCNGGLASICAADPTYDACVTDASPEDAGADAVSMDGPSADSAAPDTASPEPDSAARADTGHAKDSGKPDARDGAAKD